MEEDVTGYIFTTKSDFPIPESYGNDPLHGIVSDFIRSL